MTKCWRETIRQEWILCHIMDNSVSSVGMIALFFPRYFAISVDGAGMHGLCVHVDVMIYVAKLLLVALSLPTQS
jgi:hypothetical protein